MGTETERKFLIDPGTRFRDLNGCRALLTITQGYLAESEEASVRVRLIQPEPLSVHTNLTLSGNLTIKQNAAQLTRKEHEFPIEVTDARRLLGLCGTRIVRKRRHVIDTETLRHWTVDVFLDDNEGLFLAEIELFPEDEGRLADVNLPTWLGKEVTGDPRYYNNHLAQHPYSSW